MPCRPPRWSKLVLIFFWSFHNQNLYDEKRIRRVPLCSRIFFGNLPWKTPYRRHILANYSSNQKTEPEESHVEEINAMESDSESIENIETSQNESPNRTPNNESASNSNIPDLNQFNAQESLKFYHRGYCKGGWKLMTLKWRQVTLFREVSLLYWSKFITFGTACTAYTKTRDSPLTQVTLRHFDPILDNWHWGV